MRDATLATVRTFIPPLERIDLEEVLGLVRDKKYFVLHAPRQTGKTSALLALRDLLNGGTSAVASAALCSVTITPMANMTPTPNWGLSVPVLCRRVELQKLLGVEPMRRILHLEIKLAELGESIPAVCRLRGRSCDSAQRQQRARDRDPFHHSTLLV